MTITTYGLWIDNAHAWMQFTNGEIFTTDSIGVARAQRRWAIREGMKITIRQFNDEGQPKGEIPG